ncbi:hypothetical protein PFISCL1PPCAC_11771, partial [Pristionchus fissidentatus]
MRRLVVFAALIIALVVALTPEEEACANPLMAKLVNEKDAETKKFVTKAFKVISAGKIDDARPLVEKFDHGKFIKFLDEYMVGE